MNLMVSSVVELKQYLLIFLSISAPMLIIASLVVIIFHYIKKKKNSEDYTLAFAGYADHNYAVEEESSYHNDTDKENSTYKVLLVRQREEHKKQMEEEADRYEALLLKYNILEKEIEKFREKQDTEPLASANADELKQWQEKYLSKEAELSILQQQAEALQQELDQQRKRQEEYEKLKDSIADQAEPSELNIIISERNQQIQFLQKQLEQRTASLREIEEANYSQVSRLLSLEENNQHLQEESRQLKAYLNTKEEKLQELERSLGQKIKEQQLLTESLQHCDHMIQQLQTDLYASKNAIHKIYGTVQRSYKVYAGIMGELQPVLQQLQLPEEPEAEPARVIEMETILHED